MTPFTPATWADLRTASSLGTGLRLTFRAPERRMTPLAPATWADLRSIVAVLRSAFALSCPLALAYFWPLRPRSVA